ncbi:MAG TPA: hypothetical protein VK504_22885, partial [Vicinamibacterales bacterium]|nr:hypothetical protein [Vicinamibacterales bacterium]
LDGKGHVLIVDLSNIDERWISPNPNPSQPAQMKPESEPFPLAHVAMTATAADPDEMGVDDARVIYKSPYIFTTGSVPPLVDPETGIAFGGDVLTQKMSTAELFDPVVQIVSDLGKGLEPVNGIVPLGIEPPPHNPNVDPSDADYAFPAGSLASFRVRVTLPGAIARKLDNNKLQFAVESEGLPGALTEQTPKGLPAAHLRHNDRESHEDKRKVDLVFVHEAALDPSVSTDDFDTEFRHQAGYNRLLSPWIVALADPRASERVIWTGASAIPANPTDAQLATAATERKKSGCASCVRPKALHGLDQTTDKVFELYTNGRYIAVRPESGTPNAPMSDAMKEVYAYLGEKHRLELRVPTTMADTVRGRDITVAAQAPPVAGGALSETTYVHSGEVEVNALDLSVSGRGGHDVVLARTHRSRTIGNTVLGSGWEAPFLRRLRQLPNGDVEYRDGGGEIWLFKPVKASTSSSGGTSTGNTAADTLDTQFGTKIKYTSPKGVYLKLARNENGWMLYDQQWRIARFDNYGRLTSESDEFWKKPDSSTLTTPAGSPPPPPAGEVGNTIFYVYDSTGRLAQIFDPVGRKVNFEYWPEPATPNDPEYSCTEPNTDRTQPCKYAGRLSKITDVTRSRELLFEYDQLGRLIAVQRPKFKGPDNGPAAANSDTEARRPRVSYEYKQPAQPAYNEGLQSQTWTDFMDFSGNISKIFDAAENAPPTPGTNPTPPRARVRFDYEQTAGSVNRDRVTFQYWPCGNNVDDSCSETQAKFEYPSPDKTNVTDMLGQERDYDIIDLPNPAAQGATEPDPQNYRFKHVSKVTELAVPTLDKSGPPVAFNDAPQETNLVSSYTDFDVEGAVKSMTAANGTVIDYVTEEAHNGATGRITTKIKETRGAEKRYTKYTYDTNADNPNSANTPVKVGRSSDDSNYTDRDAQSSNRERKTVQQRDSDPSVKSKTETTFDDFGRVTTHERRVDDSDIGSGAVVTQTKVTYKDDPGASDLEKGRVDHVKSEGQASPTPGAPATLDTRFFYTALGSGGQQVEARDLNRNIHTY